MDRLLTLVSSGTIDGVSLGSTTADVRARLGDPEATGRRIWKYGALQVGFHDSRVTLLLLTAEGADDPPWDPTTDLGSVQALLTAEGIVYEVDAALTWETQITLLVPSSRAHLSFDPERGDRLVKATVAG
jgi:hypothetical protein